MRLSIPAPAVRVSLQQRASPPDSSLRVVLGDGHTAVCRQASVHTAIVLLTDSFHCASTLHVLGLQSQFDIIQGKPWFDEHNRDIDWPTNTVTVSPPLQPSVVLRTIPKPTLPCLATVSHEKAAAVSARLLLAKGVLTAQRLGNELFLAHVTINPNLAAHLLATRPLAHPFAEA